MIVKIYKIPVTIFKTEIDKIASIDIFISLC